MHGVTVAHKGWELGISECEVRARHARTFWDSECLTVVTLQSPSEKNKCYLTLFSYFCTNSSFGKFHSHAYREGNPEKCSFSSANWHSTNQHSHLLVM